MLSQDNRANIQVMRSMACALETQAIKTIVCPAIDAARWARRGRERTCGYKHGAPLSFAWQEGLKKFLHPLNEHGPKSTCLH